MLQELAAVLEVELALRAAVEQMAVELARRH